MAAPSNSEEPPQLKIYFLPNLLTAGNLFCGFLAITRIVEADLQPPYSHIKEALFYILLACIFDLFDGRVARMGGRESPFGREFDSLADVVSFGVAPAFLVHRVVLRDVFENMPEIGWFIASLYLICGALRLARFNCLAAQPGNTGGGNEFMGFPIPAAAGLVASLTLLLMWWDEQNFAKANWRFLLPGILMFLSFMMVSEVKYPSFKKLDLRARRPFAKFVVFITVVAAFVFAWESIGPAVLSIVFTTYLLYGFVRPYMTKQMRHDIEEEDEDEGQTPPQ
jgi:CDP-diacylglycerol---serine O-phosphatidyltransferase